MFFTGSLQEALASALQSNKAVVCFVTDEGEESQRWQDDFLAEDSVAQSIASAAVALRLKAGSQEAGYLAALFPLPKIPTVVILRNGELKEYLPAGTSRDDFSRRVQAALGGAAPAPRAQASISPSQDQQDQSTVNTASTTGSTAASTAETPAAPSPAPASTPSAVESPSAQASPTSRVRNTVEPESESGDVRALLAERAARLDQQREEARKRALEAYAKAKAKGKEKAEADPDDKDLKKTDRDEFADAIKKKRREAAKERQRILKRIEDDKIARQEMVAAKAREGTSTATSGGPSTAFKGSGENAAILVRLSDGSTLRKRFTKGSSIRGDVRKWVDSNRNDGSTSPYKFRVALNPATSRLIDETEEDRTLEELGLSPSATLVLVPIPSWVTANGGGGILQRTTSLFVWFYTMITTFFSSIFGSRGTSRSEEIEMDEVNPQGQPEAQQGKSSGSRVNTLQDSARQRRDHQLYNGNSLNFEPRPDDDEH